MREKKNSFNISFVRIISLFLPQRNRALFYFPDHIQYIFIVKKIWTIHKISKELNTEKLQLSKLITIKILIILISASFSYKYAGRTLSFQLSGEITIILFYSMITSFFLSSPYHLPDNTHIPSLYPPHTDVYRFLKFVIFIWIFLYKSNIYVHICMYNT